MKSIIRIYLFHLLSLWIIQQIFSTSFIIQGNYIDYLKAAGILTLLNLLLKPVLKILLFPINALTLGLFSLVINAGLFYLFLKLVPFIQIKSWLFPGFTYAGFNLPKMTVNEIGIIFIISFILSLLINFFTFLVK